MKVYVYIDLYTSVHSSIWPFIMSTRYKQPKYPSADERVTKMWHIHTVEYYLAIRRNEVLIHTTTCMNLKNILIRFKKSRHRRSHAIWLHLYKISRIGKSIKIQIIHNHRGLAGGKWRVTPHRLGASFWGEENMVKLIVMMVVWVCEYIKNHWDVHFQRVNGMLYEFHCY